MLEMTVLTKRKGGVALGTFVARPGQKTNIHSIYLPLPDLLRSKLILPLPELHMVIAQIFTIFKAFIVNQ